MNAKEKLKLLDEIDKTNLKVYALLQQLHAIDKTMEKLIKQLKEIEKAETEKLCET